ncbi:hypothetical protein QRD38_14465 [Leptospira weilii]|uniref:hypothetical protein n=1 Tax=Leptospira weilii TaxID=28184 RepID=UPI000774AE61|nr:hypothetical protein [Leptospira weilii]MDL5246963.1 hypothetical protein [Leptospira weilii]
MKHKADVIGFCFVRVRKILPYNFSDIEKEIFATFFFKIKRTGEFWRREGQIRIIFGFKPDENDRHSLYKSEVFGDLVKTI